MFVVLCLVYINIRRLSPLLIFYPLAVWDPTRAGEQVGCWFVPELKVAVGIHTGLPVPALPRVAPGLTEGRPVVGDLLGPVLVELRQTVGEGAGGAPVTVPGTAVALTENHLDWAGPGLGGDWGGERGGEREAAQLIQAVGRAAVQPAAAPGLQPQRAEVSLLARRRTRGRPGGPRSQPSHLLPPGLAQQEVILCDGPQLRLPW